MQLSIIIVNYNVKYFLEQCLCSVQKACAGLSAEIFVIDNNSEDGSKEWLENAFPGVVFIWQATNDGFGKANNQALKRAKGNYVLFLNPDCIVPEDAFELCVKEMEKDNLVGALGVRMIDGSGKFLKESKRGFPTAATSFFKMSGLSALFPKSKIFSGYYAGHLKEMETQKVDVLAGAFMMLSRKAVEITKGFDEDFFMYGEDVDLSYRVKQAGLKNIYFAGTTILHFKGESTQKFSPAYNKHFYGAMKLFVKKHFAEKKGMLFFTTIAISLGQAMAGLKGLFSQQPESSPGKTWNTAIAAGQPTFDECLHLVKYASPALAIIGRIAVNKTDNGIALGRIEDINDVLRKNKIDQLIFCEGEQRFKSIIQQAQIIPRSVQMLFHANGSRCMVGSSNKNRKGKFISRHERS